MSGKPTKLDVLKNLTMSKDSRHIAIKNILFFSLVGVVVISILPFLDIVQNYTFIDFLKTILLTITVSIFTASTIEFFAAYHKLYQRETLQFYFRAIYDCEFDQKGKVAIVIPAFSVTSENSVNFDKETNKTTQEINDKDYKNLISEKYKILDELTTSNQTIKSSSLADISAANYIASSFTSVGLDLPNVISDKEAYDDLFNGDSDSAYNTYISIGLLSNLVSLKINCNSDACSIDKTFLFEREAEYDEKGKPRKSRVRLKLGVKDGSGNLLGLDQWFNLDPVDWEFPKDKKPIQSGGPEGVMFSKIRLNTKSKQKTIIIIGGTGEAGTVLLSQKLSKNWKKHIYDRYDGKIMIRKSPFTLFFRAHPNPNMNIPMIDFVKGCPNV